MPQDEFHSKAIRDFLNPPWYREPFLLFMYGALSICFIFGGILFFKKKETCPDYPWREWAQHDYDSDSVQYANLDGNDKDGRVCEDIPSLKDL